MPGTMIHLTQAELDRIMLEAKRAQAQVIADGLRALATAPRRLAASIAHSLRAAAPRRPHGA